MKKLFKFMELMENFEISLYALQERCFAFKLHQHKSQFFELDQQLIVSLSQQSRCFLMLCWLNTTFAREPFPREHLRYILDFQLVKYIFLISWLERMERRLQSYVGGANENPTRILCLEGTRSSTELLLHIYFKTQERVEGIKMTLYLN